MSEPVQYSPSPWLCLPPQLLDRLAAGAVELLERKVPPLEDGAAMTGVWEGGTDMVVACRAPRLKQ